MNKWTRAIAVVAAAVMLTPPPYLHAAGRVAAQGQVEPRMLLM